MFKRNSFFAVIQKTICISSTVIFLTASGAVAQQACSDPEVNSTLNTLGWWTFLSQFFNPEAVPVLQEQSAWLEACCVSGQSDCLCDSPDLASNFTSSCS